MISVFRVRCRLLAAWMLILAVGSVLFAPSALAHDALVSSDPVADSVLADRPTAIRLEFDQDVAAEFASMAVTIGTHDPVTVTPAVQGRTVTADLTGVNLPVADPAGGLEAWRIGYRVISADGHPVAGLMEFSVGDASVSSVVAVDTAPPASGASFPWWAIGLLVVIGIGGFVFFGRRRLQAAAQ